MITSLQVRAARAIVGWSQQELADRAVISVNTVRRVEDEVGDVRVGTLKRLQKALEAAGVEFSPDGTAVRFVGKADGKR